MIFFTFFLDQHVFLIQSLRLLTNCFLYDFRNCRMSSKRVVITGASGLLGRAVLAAFQVNLSIILYPEPSCLI